MTGGGHPQIQHPSPAPGLTLLVGKRKTCEVLSLGSLEGVGREVDEADSRFPIPCLMCYETINGSHFLRDYGITAFQTQAQGLSESSQQAEETLNLQMRNLRVREVK